MMMMIAIITRGFQTIALSNAHIPGRCQDPAQDSSAHIMMAIRKIPCSSLSQQKKYHSEAGSNPVTLLLALQDHLI